MARVADPPLTCWTLNDDARFLFPEGDWYWSRHMQRGHYEREIDRVLRRAVDRPYALIDAGANFGYWSILASSGPYGRRPAVAIEASRSNVALLARNAGANGDRFHVLHRAILDVSGRQVRLYGEKHYGLSLREDWHPGDGGAETVETITLDDVAGRYFGNREHPPIAKVDVEGMEIEAIAGGRRLLDEGALFIYEDHGKEPSHRISRFVMSLPGLELWYIGRDERILRITSIGQIDAVKTNPNLGYNFAALRVSSPWTSLFDESA